MSDGRCIRTEEDLKFLNFDKGAGLVTVVTQHVETRTVLMLAHADREALARTLATGEMCYHSRTRGLWHKGATSGNVQRVVSLLADCDGDSVLAIIDPAGPACHLGATSCFDQDSAFGAPAALEELDRRIEARAANSPAPALSYTRRLLDDRNLRLKKLGEEASELIVACADGDRERAVCEAADLTYHMMVALRALGAGLADVQRVLHARQ